MAVAGSYPFAAAELDAPARGDESDTDS